VALVASGANGSKAHYLGDGAIAPNQPLLVDTGSAIDGYWSGTTRMFFPKASNRTRIGL
jgi:Xaa-Pro aminopeptidase